MTAGQQVVRWLQVRSWHNRSYIAWIPLLAHGLTVKLSPCPCSHSSRRAGQIAACLCGHSNCNLLLAQALPRMIQLAQALPRMIQLTQALPGMIQLAQALPMMIQLAQALPRMIQRLTSIACYVECVGTTTTELTVITLIIQTIQSFDHPPPPFPEKMLNFCIPSIQTPTFEIIIPISKHLHLAELERGLPNVY